MKNKNNFGEPWILASILLKRDMNISEIAHELKTGASKFGYYGFLFSQKERKLQDWIQETLQRMQKQGWVIVRNGVYHLTSLGREEGEKAKQESLSSINYFSKKILNPSFAARLNIIIHFILATIKLPAGLISGSISLINDSIDTLLDGVSGILVYFGIKKDLERQVSVALCIVMLLTGIFVLYSSVRKIFVSYSLYTNSLSFVVILISLGVSFAMSYFQRIVGLKRENFAVLTQSFDSQNHVLTSLGVLISLILSKAGLVWPDIIIGLLIAILIMKSAFQLGLDLIRSNRGDEFNFNAYQPKIMTFYNWLEIKQLKRWVLVFIHNHRPIDLQNLKQQATAALDFRNNVTLQYIGKNQPGNFPEKVETAFNKLKQDNLITISDRINITEHGQKYLEKLLYTKPINNLRNLITKIGGLVVGIISFLLIHIGAIFLINYLNIPVYYDISLEMNSLNNLSLLEGLLPLAAFGIFAVGLLRFLKIYTNYHHLLKNDQQNDIQLIEHGIYGRYRHPMYGTFILMQNGIFLSFPSIWTLLPASLLTFLNLINGWWEEKFILKPSIGEDYSHYKQKVKRKYLSIFSWFFIALLYIYHLFLLFCF